MFCPFFLVLMTCEESCLVSKSEGGWGPARVRVRPSHVFKGKLHFRGGLHLLSQKSVASFKYLSLKHSFYCLWWKETKEKQKTWRVIFATTKTKKTKCKYFRLCLCEYFSLKQFVGWKNIIEVHKGITMVILFSIGQRNERHKRSLAVLFVFNRSKNRRFFFYDIRYSSLLIEKTKIC